MTLSSQNGLSSNGSSKVKSPASLAHVVFRTANFEKMLSFWRTFLGAEVTFKSDSIAFLRYDEEHHRIAIIAVPDSKPKDPKAVGLAHVAFAFETLNDLAATYLQRKALGMEPIWCVNHGPTTSIYYNDPDGNSVETQVDNYETPEQANDFMAGKYFGENPIGTDFDPMDLVRRLQEGLDHVVIKKRVEIGPRDVPDFI